MIIVYRHFPHEISLQFECISHFWNQSHVDLKTIYLKDVYKNTVTRGHFRFHDGNLFFSTATEVGQYGKCR